MSDNISLGGYCGNVVLATDDIANVHYQRTKVNFGSDGAAVDVSTSNPLPVDLVNVAAATPLPVDAVMSTSVVDTNNSTTTPLAAAATFTGTATNVLGYKSITVAVHADEDSAADGMRVEYSRDGVTWNHIYKGSLVTSVTTEAAAVFPIIHKFMRFVYVNGAADQGTFHADVILHPTDTHTGVPRISDMTFPEAPAALVKSVNVAKIPSGAYQNIEATAGGNLKMSVQEFSDGVNVGNGSVDTETLRVTIADDSTGQINLDQAFSKIDTNNSTTTPLNAGIAFTGTGTDVLGYTAITITLYASHASAASGMTFQFSTDDTNWDDIYSFNMGAGSTRRFQFPITAQYFRVVFTNGGTNQTAFRVQTLLHPVNQLTSIHRLVDDMSEDRSGQVVKTALFAHDDTNELFKPVAVTADAQLRVVNEAGVANGCDMFRSLDIDETEEAIKATAGNMYWIHGLNTVAQERYLKFYNGTVASVVVGTTVPVLTIPLLRSVAFDMAITQGLFFDTAITVACTTGVLDSDTGAPGAGDVIVNIAYK